MFPSNPIIPRNIEQETHRKSHPTPQQVPGHWTSMGPIGAPPDLDLTHLSRDRRPGGLGGPQRELLKEAVQCNGRHLRKLDPAMCPEAEWRLDWDGMRTTLQKTGGFSGEENVDFLEKDRLFP
jgi:hypothetical protein